MSNLTPLSSLIGLAIAWVRLRGLFSAAPIPRNSGLETVAWPSNAGFVSIIVPARNEEANLPRLLRSLLSLDGEIKEIIVVDDGSTDRTAEIVQHFSQLAPAGPPVRLLTSTSRPAGWCGKNWACHQGYLNSRAELLLFTDADTEHIKTSLCTAVSELRNRSLQLLTAVPFHRSESLWERLLGPFHLLLLIGAAPFSQARNDRIFAIGQYLLFEREQYIRQGGHLAVRESLGEDIDLATNCLAHGGRQGVLPPGPYRVRMFFSFAAFFSGWRRIFRLGLSRSTLTASVEVYFVVAALTASFAWQASSYMNLGFFITGSAMVATAVLFWRAGRRLGEFSPLGVLFLPFSLSIFIGVALTAMFDLVLSRKIHWRGRDYSAN